MKKFFVIAVLLTVTTIFTGCQSVSGLFGAGDAEPEASGTRAEPGAVKGARDKPTPMRPSSSKALGYEHKVAWPGETLSVIALWYTGSTSAWTAIAKANPNIDPYKIHIGDKIIIPRSLLKRAKPMPRDFVARFVSNDGQGAGLGHIPVNANAENAAEDKVSTDLESFGKQGPGQPESRQKDPGQENAASQNKDSSPKGDDKAQSAPPPVLFGPKDL